MRLRYGPLSDLGEPYTLLKVLQLRTEEGQHQTGGADILLIFLSIIGHGFPEKRNTLGRATGLCRVTSHPMCWRYIVVIASPVGGQA